MNNPMQWPTRELFWAGLAFDEEDAEEDRLTPEEGERLRVYFHSLKAPVPSSHLADDTLVRVGADRFCGMVWLFQKPVGRIDGFGIRAADEMQARMSLGRANRILGRAGIDREAGVWHRLIFANVQEGATT